MAHSKISICNISLALLGASSIRSFDENNKRARMCDVMFDASRDYLLSKFDWPFARFRLALQEVTFASNDYEHQYPPGVYVYKLPSDCKTPRDVYPDGSRQPWRVEGGYLLSPNPPEMGVSLLYTGQAVDTALFSDTFVDLLALRIAVKMSPSITQDKAITTQLMEQYDAEKFESWESDANIGNDYRAYNENPENDTFVWPEGSASISEFWRS